MIGILGFGLIWGAGRYLALPRRLLWGLTVLWWGLMLVRSFPYAGGVEAIQPYDPDKAEETLQGAEFMGWITVGILTAAVMLYRQGLSSLRHRLRTPDIPAPAGWTAGAFSDSELDRYARHIMLREIGGPGQRALKAARVLVVGAGGLGSPALLYLAGAGVGTIGVIDDDVVDNTNLQRQIIHADPRIGMAKVQSAAIAMQALNPHVAIRPYKRRLTEEIAADLIADYDLVLDGSDNFDTRYLVNRVCAQAGKPLIAAAITQWEGQISLYDPARGGPCYACVFPVRPADGLVPTCAEAGVAAPLPGILGAMMAMEAIKEITGAGAGLTGRLMIHDALYGETRMIGVKRRTDCPVCGHDARRDWTVPPPAP
jgi:molybdopterin/thiamine biosynthesis adenylyltransferase